MRMNLNLSLYHSSFFRNRYIQGHAIMHVNCPHMGRYSENKLAILSLNFRNRRKSVSILVGQCKRNQESFNLCKKTAPGKNSVQAIHPLTMVRKPMICRILILGTNFAKDEWVWRHRWMWFKKSVPVSSKSDLFMVVMRFLWLVVGILIQSRICWRKYEPMVYKSPYIPLLNLRWWVTSIRPLVGHQCVGFWCQTLAKVVFFSEEERSVALPKPWACLLNNVYGNGDGGRWEGGKSFSSWVHVQEMFFVGWEDRNIFFAATRPLEMSHLGSINIHGAE